MKNLVIITGGIDLEHEISLKSAFNLRRYIDSSKFNIYLVQILLDGNWVLEGKLVSFYKHNATFCLTNSDYEISVDYVFPIIHGKGVENGDLQGFFSTLLFKNLIANNLYSSCVTFDKIFAKRIAKSLDIPIVPYIDFFSCPCNFTLASKQLKNKSLFLKPANNGSSFGCYKIANAKQFNEALGSIKPISDYILIESGLNVIECCCSILHAEISDVIVINSIKNFFSYEEKYEKHDFKISLLDDLTLVDLIKNYSLKLWKAMRFNFMCRFDFFICKSSKKIYFNEANSLPGLGEESLFFYSFSFKYSKEQIVEKILEPWLK